MSAASPLRSGAPSSGLRPQGARRPAANPWRVDLRELGRRAGSMQELDRTAPAPEDWRVELVGVPAGTEVRLRLRLESVMEGVLVSGEIAAPLTGSCARCLEPIEDTLSLHVQELYAYAGSTTEATSEEDEVRRIEGDYLDLEPLARDSIVLALPLAPVCRDDCAGLCVDCGQRLDDLPADHAHEVVDARWAGLAAKFGTPSTSSPGAPGESPTTEEN
ncbi:MAG: FIG01269488: protein, clustered with ribosomal protein L32p [uncultured Blastococcus sp.]|uniref:FIG01269488: protein, clustered with ribosomal protein L32p n=1 Tax=uncultured Blastococcus sp. TaxID=217144 RepID=A0A6J4J770_9ACTN|nr:MAG: FIG01269488: protein, clustered with ribosomal protein L32p [uncultured Blastococcus sp.]